MKKLLIFFKNKQFMIFVIENSRIIKALNSILSSEVIALTIGPVIMFNGKYDHITLNHESIHCQQYMETFYIGFLIIYLYDYIKNRLSGMLPIEAYENIRAEKEAYMYENDKEYLKSRKRFLWLFN